MSEEALVAAEIEIESGLLNESEDDWVILKHEDHDEEQLEIPSATPSAAEHLGVPSEAPAASELSEAPASEPATLANRMTETLRALRIPFGTRPPK